MQISHFENMGKEQQIKEVLYGSLQSGREAADSKKEHDESNPLSTDLRLVQRAPVLTPLFFLPHTV